MNRNMRRRPKRAKYPPIEARPSTTVIGIVVADWNGLLSLVYLKKKVRLVF